MFFRKIKTKEVLSKLDTTVFKGKAFINKATFFSDLLKSVKSKQVNKDGSPILTLTPLHFSLISDLVADADLGNKKKPKELDEIQKKPHDLVTKSNIIPIGIINTEAVQLSDEQLAENIKAKEQKKKL